MKNKAWYDEALKYAITVPIIVHPEGKVEYGWKGNIGCPISDCLSIWLTQETSARLVPRAPCL